MKKVLSLLLSVIMIMLSITAVPMSSVAATSSTSIDLSEEHQTMNGFGASACWWAKDVGGWENLNDIMALLYSKDKGIGLNIYRYNLGAGSDKDALNYSADRWTEAFINADGSYDWSRDVNAKKALAAAKKLAGDKLRVTLFCNSAPVYITKNSCAIGNDYWWDSNLEESNYDAFADYGYNCVDYFQSLGYRVTDISPVNEPYGHWCRYNDWIPDLDENGEKVYDENGNEMGHTVYYDWAGQEGCYYTCENVRDLSTKFIKRFSGTPVEEKGCKITVFEANDININDNEETELSKYIKCLFNREYKTQTIRENVDTITLHSYWTSRQAKQRAAEFIKSNPYYKDYKLAQTEYCQMELDENTGVFDLVNGKMSSGLGIEYGLALANVIYDDITILDVAEWDWWTAVAFGGYTDGLVYVDNNTHNIETSKRLYTMGNFSKFTDEGSVRVGAVSDDSALKTAAFKNPDGTISIVFINDTNSAKQTNLNIKGLSTSCYSYTSYVTDKTRNLAQYQTRASSNTATVPAQSVTTVVVKPCSHNMITTTQKATLTANGKITTKCSNCTTASNKTIAYPKTIKLSATSYVYDGKVKKPSVTVKDSGGKTIASSNYTVTYPSGRKNVGKYSVKITFRGNYSGTKTLDFTIVPKATTLSSVTAASKAFTVKWKKQATQTTGYEIQFATDSKFTKNKKSVVVSKNTTTSKKVTKLSAKKKYYVRIRTYKTVSGKKYYSAWSKSKNVTTKK